MYSPRPRIIVRAIARDGLERLKPLPGGLGRDHGPAADLEGPKAPVRDLVVGGCASNPCPPAKLVDGHRPWRTLTVAVAHLGLVWIGPDVTVRV